MNNIELLSPVGDFQCLKAAVQNGADAVYLGASSFSARAKAKNFETEHLLDAIKYAKLRNVSVHLALNTLIKNSEFEEAVNLAITAYNLGVDAIIVQDLGLASYLLKNYPNIPLHASTQMTVHNLDGVKQLEKMGFSRIVLARELSIQEIEYIRKNSNIELEVFIHGALCISYSGQCLLSSMIGGRSGNRGLCAQPCRLPYELCKKDLKGNISTIDKGYLLSPRDNFAIEYLPELIKLGINSLKIEGRMKTPTYVGVVTKIYRKYIDLVLNNINLNNKDLKYLINKNLDYINEDTLLSDREEITQVFNRGGFSTGHFSNNGNNNLIFKEKPNNLGIFVGTVSSINENKGYINLKLENTLSISDKILINDELYTISELMMNNKNYKTLQKGAFAKIGRMKGKISIGSKIYRMESSLLNQSMSPSFDSDKNIKKIKLNGQIIIKTNSPITIKLWANSKFYKGFVFEKTYSIYPNIAQNKPINKDMIIKQLSKTGNTEFEFESLNVILDDNLFLQMSTLNDLRRTALKDFENYILKNYYHNTNFIKLNYDNKNNKNYSKKSVSLLLNTLDINLKYLDLTGINKLYIPLKYHLDYKYNSLLNSLCKKFSTYIYLPHILKDNNLKCIDFEEIIKKRDIRGFVISHISQIEKIKNFNLEIIGNFNLNVFNNYTIDELKKLNFTTYTISPELNISEMNDVLTNSCLNSEVIIYGKIPVMTNNYCYIGKTNKCKNNCKINCNSSLKFYLKDRMNAQYRIIQNNISSTTTVFNSKNLNIDFNILNNCSVRIDILEETPEEIQKIINSFS